MAFRALPSYCTDTAYEDFLPLRGFSPAKGFCSNLAVHQRSLEDDPYLDSRDSVPIAAYPRSQRDVQCPAESGLCSLLSKLQSADKTIAHNACRCIGVYVLVPGITTAEQPTRESITNPTAKHGTEPTIRHSSRDTDWPTSNSLPKITSNPEMAGTTSFASKITTTSEWIDTTPSFASVPSSALTSDTTSSSSGPIIATSSRASSSTSSLLSTSSCTSTDSISYSSISATPSSSHSIISSSSSSGSFISASTTSSTTSSVCSPTCTYPTATTSCPTVTATGLAYKQYYAGQCFIENTYNPGSGGEPAIYTRFKGIYDMCAATQYCANAAGAAYGPYHSFDLHYYCSNSTWMCVQYFNGNSDESYFNVLSSDVAVAFGYSY